MHAIFSQLSGLVGLFVFLARVWRLAPIEGAVFTGVSAALAVYLTLALGDVAIRRIISQHSSEAHGTATPDSHHKRANSSRSSDERSLSEEPALAGAAA